MSSSYSSRLRGGGAGGGLGATTLLAAKVAFASGALAAAVSLARAALPQLVSGADAFLWKLYLFITVHVIIFVIWKLSNNKHFQAAAQQHKDPWAPVPHHPAPPLLTEDLVRPSMKCKVEFAPAEKYRVPQLHEAVSPVEQGVVSPGSCCDESCVTTESEEDESYAAVTSSLPPTAYTRGAMVAAAEYFDDAGHDVATGDDDLDATWNAIMQRTRPAISSIPKAPG
ncbi:uncharacterized protein LOC124671096 [Lolium rigidum]|uniref:uncharacterized protein LOC124671096 n=1 Tax=Lolium rigidum TaxID=89674 RepID=UPI001F5DFEA6|nr:uncharacterized protein LOC124671096 [Lolium rigidum]